jgi:hypothetical protein
MMLGASPRSLRHCSTRFSSTAWEFASDPVAGFGGDDVTQWLIRNSGASGLPRFGVQSNCFLLLNENVVSWNQSYMLWYQGGPPGSPRSANTRSVCPLSMRSRSVGSGSPGCNVAT